MKITFKAIRQVVIYYVMNAFLCRYHTEAPVTVTQPLTCPDLQAGKMASAECQLSVEGVSVTWLKDSMELEVGVKYQFTTEGKRQVLLIKDFEAADQGVYTCLASDEAESSIKLNLPVKGE